MRKRNLWVLLLAIMLAVGAASGAFAQKKTDITIWCMAFDPHANGFTNVIEAFNKANPSIRVTLEPQPGQAEMTAKIRAALAAGKSEAAAFTTTGTTVGEGVALAVTASRRAASAGWLLENIANPTASTRHKVTQIQIFLFIATF